MFDLDGTLVDTNIDFSRLKAKILALVEKHGLDPNPFADRHILELVSQAASLMKGRKAAAFTAEANKILEEIEVHSAENGCAVDGANEVLAALRESGTKIGIVTRNCRAAAYLSLRKSGLQAEIVLTREDVENAKPHPSHLLKALKSLGVEPENAVMVE